VNSSITHYASTIPGFLGTGGMLSKIKAARNATLGGIPVIIANGRKKNILTDIFSGKECGTLFLPDDSALCGRKCWIAFTKAPKGELVIDTGAVEAIKQRGKSLLPSGIKEVKGNFGLGDSAVLLDEEGHKIAIGMVNYPARDIAKIAGLRSMEIESTLGYKHDDEVIHRDNLVLTTDMEDN
jgi:glutamate 5-kinase